MRLLFYEKLKTLPKQGASGTSNSMTLLKPDFAVDNLFWFPTTSQLSF